MFSADLNGRQQEGVGYSQMTRKGRFRGSTAQTFLARRSGGTNLRVETEALATRLLFEGRRCIGVASASAGRIARHEQPARSSCCGGAVNSPHLLQISGIGPAEHLQSIGVDVVHELPGVGANLQDHYVARISHRVRNAMSINQLAQACGWRGRRCASCHRARRADLRRHQRAGVLSLAAGGTCQPRPATSVYAGQLRCGALRPAGARAWHDRRRVSRTARQPWHHHGEITRPVGTPVLRQTTCLIRTTSGC